MALFGVLGMYAAAPTSGTGTADDPYIVESGTNYSIPSGQLVYASFTAPSSGVLTFNQTTNVFANIYLTTTDGTGLTRDTDYSTYNKYSLNVEAGKTYVVAPKNNFMAVEITVEFEAVEGITATATPADGSSMEELVSTLQKEVEGEPFQKTTYPITVKLSKAVGFVAATFADSKNDFRTTVRGHNYDIAVEYQRVTSTGGSMGDSQGDVTGETVPEFYLGEQTSDTWMIGPEVAAARGETLLTLLCLSSTTASSLGSRAAHLSALQPSLTMVLPRPSSTAP